MPEPYRILTKGEKQYKLCKGSQHPDGGEWISTEDYARRTGRKGQIRLRGQCKACEHAMKYGKTPPANIGYMPVGKIRFALDELERRLGRTEAARQCEIGKTTWYALATGQRYRVQKSTAAKVLRTLFLIRKDEIVRHKKDIRRGTWNRGESDRHIPRKEHEFNRSRFIQKADVPLPVFTPAPQPGTGSPQASS